MVYCISEKPTASVSTSKITVNEGENVTLSCTSTGGNPPAKLTWTKDGEKISEAKERENKLFLKNIRAEDAETYVCTAESYPDDKYRDSKKVALIVNCKYLGTSVTFYSYILLLLWYTSFSCNVSSHLEQLDRYYIDSLFELLWQYILSCRCF